MTKRVSDRQMIWRDNNCGGQSGRVSATHSDRRKVRARKERLPVELHPGEAGRYIGGVDQQHLPGNEPADPAEDLFCAVENQGYPVIFSI